MNELANNPLIEIVPLPPKPPVNMQFRRLVVALQKKIESLPGAMIGDCFPLKHSFAEGVYIREIVIPKGMFCIGKLHKESYINCIMMGDMTVFTEQGVKRIKGPCSVVAPAGTKRFGYSHEETVWITVHPNPTNSDNIEMLEKEIHAEDYDVLDDVIDVPNLESTFNNLMLTIINVFDADQFRQLTEKVFAHEKPGFWSDWTSEQQKLYMSGDWEAFSRSRGYTEEEISDMRLWIMMLEKGTAQGHKPLEIINDLSVAQAAKNIALDKNNEILKSSHIPSSKKLPYREVANV